MFDQRGTPCYEACANKIEDREMEEVKGCLFKAGLIDTVCRSLQDAITDDGDNDGSEAISDKTTSMKSEAMRLNTAATLLGVMSILVAVMGAMT
jgi:hypothetical protein